MNRLTSNTLAAAEGMVSKVVTVISTLLLKISTSYTNTATRFYYYHTYYLADRLYHLSPCVLVDSLLVAR
jgi:hypothetical protein